MFGASSRRIGTTLVTGLATKNGPLGGGGWGQGSGNPTIGGRASLECGAVHPQSATARTSEGRCTTDGDTANEPRLQMCHPRGMTFETWWGTGRDLDALQM